MDNNTDKNITDGEKANMTQESDGDKKHKNLVSRIVMLPSYPKYEYVKGHLLDTEIIRKFSK